MSCDHLWTTKRTSNGFGLHLMQTLVQLWVFTLVHAMKPQHANYGKLYLRCIANAPSPTPISGEHYGAVLPSKRRRATGKRTGKTSYIERFNNTLKQRVSRLMRKTLSFSKLLENHMGMIWYFIDHYNI
jgi:insertion element IS1 protein InsB